MKKNLLTTCILSALIVFGSLGSVSAQTNGGPDQSLGSQSIAGDELCGSYTKSGQTVIIARCTLKSAQIMANRALVFVISLGLPLLVLFITYRFIAAWFQLQQGNANAYRDALKKAGNALLGFIIIVLLFAGGLVLILKFLGVKSDGDFNPLRILQPMSALIFTHAYAADQQLLPNPLGVTNLYDLILNFIRVLMRFFVYPALIVIWVISGFSFVMAQGSPEGIKKAKSWLTWAVITTLIVFTVQMFLVAMRGTVTQVLGGEASQSAGTPDGRVAPVAGESGSVCDVNGVQGTRGTDGVCYTASRAGSSASGYCSGKANGTMCTIPVASAVGGYVDGTCSTNSEEQFTCNKAMEGDYCVSSAENVGTYKNGACSSGRGSSQNSCSGKPEGTLCSVPFANGVSRPGTCARGSNDVYDCYVATKGDKCLGQGFTGVISSSGICIRP